jgi:sortase A
MVRKLGFVFVGLGVLMVAWVGVTIWWGDPITSLYTAYEQRALSHKLDSLNRQWATKPVGLPTATAAFRNNAAVSEKASLAAIMRLRASAFERGLTDGSPIGRIVIPRLHLRMVVLQGTTEGDLQEGPGHYDAASGRSTGLPGMGEVIGVAGHRTTFLHPFRHIDDLRSGDNVYLEMPYGTFRYTVYFHKVVESNDWSILRSRSFEKLVLSACHPLYSASHRWVVFARRAGVSLGAAGV